MKKVKRNVETQCFFWKSTRERNREEMNIFIRWVPEF